LKDLRNCFRSSKLLILDSDGVSVPAGTEILETATEEYHKVVVKTNIITDALANKINKLKTKIRVCVSSGRSLLYLQGMYSKILGGGVILQAENGNLSLVDGQIIQHVVYGDDYFTKMALIRNDIRKLNIEGFEPKQFILTVHAKEEIPEIYDIVRRYDFDNELKVMWNGEAFDIQKGTVSKGEGVKAISSYLGIDLKDVIAIGDKINDREMILVVGVGISTNKKTLEASYYMSADELIDLLLL
jgi:HAD superfamily hydrolase (TIGR01484 family)